MTRSRLTLVSGFLALAAMVSMPLPAQTNAKMTKQEAANLKLVEEWWRTVLVAHHIDQMTKFADENMIQHNPTAPNGLAPLRKIFGSRPPTDIPASITPPPALELSQGDIVMIVFDHEAKDPTDPSKTYHYNSLTPSVSKTTRSSSTGTARRKLLRAKVKSSCFRQRSCVVRPSTTLL